MILYKLGARIRTLRKEQGLSLLDVSKKTDMAKSNLSSIETGKRGVNHKILKKIICALGYTEEQSELKILKMRKDQIEEEIEQFYEDIIMGYLIPRQYK